MRRKEVLPDGAPRDQTDQRRLAESMVARSYYSGAFDVLRKMSRVTAVETRDLQLFFTTLRVTRPELRDRWLRRLNYRKAANLIAPMRYARLLMIAGENDAAVACYCGLPRSDLAQEAARFCFEHLVATCRFGAAETLCVGRSARDLSPSQKHLVRHEEGLALSQSWGLGPDDDFWRAAISRLTELTAPLRDTYEPNRKCLLLCLAGIGIGGIERQADLLADAASTRSHASVAMLSLSAGDPPSSERSTPYAHRNIVEFMGCRTVREGIDGFEEVQSIANLLRLEHLTPMLEAVVQLRPDVVHNCHQSRLDVLVAAALLGVPRLVADLGNLHPSRILAANSAWLGLLNKTYRYAAERPCTRLVANSKGGLRNWAEHSGLPQRLFHYIYNPFDPARLGQGCDDRPAFRRALGIPECAPVVGGVFRFEPMKDPLLWTEVARIVARKAPEAHFLLVGDGHLLGPVQARVREVGLADCVHFPGARVDDLLAYYQAMDVFLLASRAEGLPNVIIEAQHAGLPVVAPNVGGTAEAIASADTGTVVADRSAGALADAVIAYLKDASRRETIATMAPGLVAQRFSREVHLRAYEAVYGWADRPPD
jgi:glycosyltransferase involved in cell wall biosynthesis